MPAVPLRNAPFVLLDDSRKAHRAGLSYLYHTPHTIIEAHDFDEVPAALEALDKAVAGGKHVAGWLSYEIAHLFEDRLAAILTRKAEEPLIWMMVTDHCETLSPTELEAMLHAAEEGNERIANLETRTPDVDRIMYKDALERVHAYIEAGDVYQINYTFQLPLELGGDPLAFYRRLRAAQRVSYGAYIDTGSFRVLSLSPELFVRKEGKTLMARPMKGTAPRGMNSAGDAEASAYLKSDSKSLAENLMIVDLIRNDISRVSKPTTVKVPERFTVETYITLHQMTSTVTAEAVDGLTPSALLRAMFPCGSVTGAPKIRAMEVIAELEGGPRGVYCGAIGHFSHRGSGAERQDHWCLNVPIRTVVLNDKGVGHLGVGSGVVADSQSDSEYEECLLKASFLKRSIKDFALIETMRVEKGEVCYLDLHLDRLLESATYFDIPLNRSNVLADIAAHIAVLGAGETDLFRLRLLVGQCGQVSITSSPFINTQDNSPLFVALSKTPIMSENQFQFHKTTLRAHYDAGFKLAQSQGLADLLYLNEHGHVVEGAISSVFAEIDGHLYTPPLADGALPGVLRRHTLAAHQDASEKSLTVADLLAAKKLYVGNALRGLREVTLKKSEETVLFL